MTPIPAPDFMIAAYLESPNPEKITLYERLGFEVVGEIQVGSSAVIMRMLRVAWLSEYQQQLSGR